MKTATMPPLRVDPELRQEAESVLREGETISSFMEQALRAGIRWRKEQQAFIARGLASRDEALASGEYVAADEVLVEIADLLRQVEAKGRR